MPTDEKGTHKNKTCLFNDNLIVDVRVVLAAGLTVSDIFGEAVLGQSDFGSRYYLSDRLDPDISESHFLNSHQSNRQNNLQIINLQ